MIKQDDEEREPFEEQQGDAEGELEDAALPAAGDQWEDEEEDEEDEEVEVEYYLLDTGEVGRLEYDHEAEEYIAAEIMSVDGEWDDCEPADVFANGEPISDEEAAEYIEEFGGTM
jgi:hypothetical protein